MLKETEWINFGNRVKEGRYDCFQDDSDIIILSDKELWIQTSPILKHE